MPDQPKPDYPYCDANASCAHDYLLEPVKELVRCHAENGRSLDFGCGNGFLSNEISKLGIVVTGVDLSESGVRIARGAYPHIDFHVADLEADLIPPMLPEASFDVVVSTEVVEHVFQPRPFVRNAFRLLRPGGHLIVTTPYHGYVKNLLIALLGKTDLHHTALWDGGHIKFWSRATLTELLTEQGFDVVGFFGAGRVPYVWKSMILVARRPS